MPPFDEMFYKPLFWSILATFAITIITFGLFYINHKTFKIIYSKPHIQIRPLTIQESKDGSKPHSLISIYIINPCSYNNLIIGYKLRYFMFGTIIDQNSAEISLPPFGKKDFNFILNYNKIIKYKNKFVVLTLIDLRKNKIHKYFRLTDKNFTT